MSTTSSEKVSRRRKAIKSYRAKADARRSRSDKFADFVTAKLGSVQFLLVNAAWFVIWIAWNVNAIPGLTAFDPYPFGFLTMTVSLEAIFLAIIVLVSQNRAAKVAEIREEVALHVDSITEDEVTKLIRCVAILLKHQGYDVEGDPELSDMVKPLNSDELEKIFENQLS